MEMNKYVVEVVALSSVASKSLALQRADEMNLMEKIKINFKVIPKAFYPKMVKRFLKIKSVFTEDEQGLIVKHVMSNFYVYSEEHKKKLLHDIEKMMWSNNCASSDFEVLFRDE